ncbi:hypothetical protein WISP_26035 [Willisornis vidua]|uniref:Uncharacterized protein n=1 Tax=Willisornis vidua TaxID=1566151 RepID=A0ABQ9DLT4_9PASS|nr:hypothetical protein WISP_26035 [Willisornis vidua]
MREKCYDDEEEEDGSKVSQDPRPNSNGAKQRPVVPPVLSCMPSCWLHDKPHAQKHAVDPAMPLLQLSWEQLETE